MAQTAMIFEVLAYESVLLFLPPVKSLVVIPCH